MDSSVEAREYGWIDSSDSNYKTDLFIEEYDSDLLSSDDDEVPFARHGPIVEPDLANLASQRDFWNLGAIEFNLDY